MRETSNPPNRRRWLQSASLLTLGTVLTADSLSKLSPPQPREVAGTPFPPPPEKPVLTQAPAPPTEPDPVAAEGLTYEQFLARFDLRHIQPQEIINPHRQSKGGITNTLPPIALWSALPPTLFIADEIRERLGRPLKLITSAYRNPSYNRACGGASGSWHTKNCALDLAYKGGPRDAYDIACELRETGHFQGGIGLYRTFIHLDTRGYNRTWRG